MTDVNLGSINLKPNKPDLYDGKRDFLAVNTWLFKIQQDLSLAALSNPSVKLTDENRIMFASSFLTSTATSWWYTVVQSGHTPSTWEDFRTLVLNAFVPTDHIRRARDKLRGLRQTHSVSKYLAEFRNCILTISDISEGELLDRYVQGLKPDVKLEVLKTQVSGFEEATKVSLRVDSALWSSSSKSTFGSTVEKHDPMEIGNVQKQSSEGPRRQRALDLKNNACVVCHTKNCRPWKCGKKKGKVNNFEAHEDDIVDTFTFDDAVDTDQEN